MYVCMYLSRRIMKGKIYQHCNIFDILNIAIYILFTEASNCPSLLKFSDNYFTMAYR
jgi:hypothetical protein